MIRSAFQSRRIPTTAEPNALLAVYWTDLLPQANYGGQMRSWGNASMFVVEWARMPHYAGGACLRVLDVNACMKRSHFQLQVTLHSTFAC